MEEIVFANTYFLSVVTRYEWISRNHVAPLFTPFKANDLWWRMWGLLSLFTTVKTPTRVQATVAQQDPHFSFSQDSALSVSYREEPLVGDHVENWAEQLQLADQFD